MGQIANQMLIDAVRKLKIKVLKKKEEKQQTQQKQNNSKK